MPRPATEKKRPSEVSSGTVIRLPKNGPDDVVKSVSVVLHMSQGQDIVYGSGDEVSVLVKQPAPQVSE